MNFKGKVAIVTGASFGIGLATAKLLSKEGAKVVLAARSLEKLEVLSKILPGSLAIPCDMTDTVQIKEMVKKSYKHFGKIDILVNNAGRGYDAQVEKINIKTLHDIFDLDVVGPLIAMQEVIPIMRSQKEGKIINISSGTALMTLPNMGGYSSLKKALVGLSLTAREELKDDNIKVSVVYPYITLTDFEKNTIKEGGEKQWEEEEDKAFKSFDGVRELRPPDSAQYIAQKILEGIESGEAEIYAHDWMKH